MNIVQGLIFNRKYQQVQKPQFETMNLQLTQFNKIHVFRFKKYF